MALTSLNWADETIGVIIMLSIIISLVRGFIREALSLITWVLAFWVALSFSSYLAVRLEPYIAASSMRTIAAFIILFTTTLIVGGMVNYVITVLIEKTGLTGTDRILGIIFGFGRGVLLVAVLLLLAKLTPLQDQPWWKTSNLIPRFEPLEVWLHSLLPASVSEQFNPGK